MIEFLSYWHMNFMDVSRIPIILMALLVTMIAGVGAGPFAGNANPFMWWIYDKLFGGVGDRLDRRKRTQSDLMLRGFVLCIFALIISVLICKLMIFAHEIYSGYDITRIIILSFFLSSGSIWFVLLRLYFAFAQDKVGEGAYYALARTTRRNFVVSDSFTMTRIALVLSVRSFDKALVAPSIWYLIGGELFLCVYTALAALAWRFGKDGFNMGFAAIVMALEKLMGFIPSIISAMIVTVAANITPTAKMHQALTALINTKNVAPYEQGGLPLSALAWGLNLSLGGASQDISGSAIKSAWVGPEGASAKIDHTHLRRGLYLNLIAHLLFIAMVLSMYVWGNAL